MSIRLDCSVSNLGPDWLLCPNNQLSKPSKAVCGDEKVYRSIRPNCTIFCISLVVVVVVVVVVLLFYVHG